MTDIRSHHTDLGDCIVHWLSAGDGPPVVLLHGIAQTSHEGRHVIPHLAGRLLAAGRRAHLRDQ
jgi:pimeloyl-ACP methyl ester carboxylesterase